jgi:hypothetical protein
MACGGHAAVTMYGSVEACAAPTASDTVRSMEKGQRALLEGQ